MARVILNSAISLARGRIGEVEFRRHNGGTVAQARQRRVAPWSRRQHHHRDHFKTLAAYAAGVRADPVWRKFYAAAGRQRNQKRLNYWQVAIRDRANPPEVTKAWLLDDVLRRPNTIAVYASDDTQVVRVHVAVRAAAGAVIDAGEARREGEKWVYTIASLTLAQRPAASVVATAFDRPGNFAVGMFALNR